MRKPFRLVLIAMACAIVGFAVLLLIHEPLKFDRAVVSVYDRQAPSTAGNLTMTGEEAVKLARFFPELGPRKVWELSRTAGGWVDDVKILFTASNGQVYTVDVNYGLAVWASTEHGDLPLHDPNGLKKFVNGARRPQPGD